MFSKMCKIPEGGESFKLCNISKMSRPQEPSLLILSYSYIFNFSCSQYIIIVGLTVSAHPLQSIGFRCETWPQQLTVVLLHLGWMWNQKLYFSLKIEKSESERPLLNWSNSNLLLLLFGNAFHIEMIDNRWCVKVLNILFIANYFKICFVFL